MKKIIPLFEQSMASSHSLSLQIIRLEDVMVRKPWYVKKPLRPSKKSIVRRKNRLSFVRLVYARRPKTCHRPVSCQTCLRLSPLRVPRAFVKQIWIGLELYLILLLQKESIRDTPQLAPHIAREQTRTTSNIPMETLAARTGRQVRRVL
jgi:hypothetical protein